MVCFRYIIISTLHTGDEKDDDNDDNNNNNIKSRAGTAVLY